MSMIDSRLNPNTTSWSCQVPAFVRSAVPRAPHRLGDRVRPCGGVRPGGQQSQQSAHNAPVCRRTPPRSSAAHPGPAGCAPARLVSTRSRSWPGDQPGRPATDSGVRRRVGGGGQWAEHSETDAVSRRVPAVRQGSSKVVALAVLSVPFAHRVLASRTCIRFGWPVGVTPQAEQMRHLWTWSAIAALVVGAITWGAMFWAVIFHRKRRTSDEHRSPADPVQPAAGARLHGRSRPSSSAVLFGFTVLRAELRREGRARPDLTVDVTAFQWNWDFAYPGQQGAGRQGRSSRSARARTIPILVLPTDRSIQFYQHSNDVIHSFFDPGVPVQARRVPAAGEERPGPHLGDRPDRPRGRLRRPLRRAVRQLPLADELRGPGALAATSTTAGSSCASRSTRPPAPRTPPVRRSAALNCGRTLHADGHHDLPVHQRPHPALGVVAPNAAGS